MLTNNYYILTGGPGAGKSSVLDELKNRGFIVVSEVGRKIIKEQYILGGNATHAGDKIAFRDLMLKHSIVDYKNNLSTREKVFFDRGIPDVYGYSELIGIPVPQTIKQAIETYRYNSMVFIFPPWEEIYGNDEERKQDFQEAIDTYSAMKKAYSACEYTLLEIPKGSVKARTEFILKKLTN